MVKTGGPAEPDARTLADISSLADGTLDAARVQAVLDLIARSPELSRRYEDERRAVAALRDLRADRAPASLRAAVSARPRPARPPRRGLMYAAAFSSAVAAVTVAIVLLLPGGAPGSPSVSQAAALALRGPVMAPPAPHSGARLNQDVQEVYFPDWSRLGWRAIGQRVDRLGGRTAVTVYYAWRGRHVAYTILTAPPLRWPGATTHMMHGIGLQSLDSGSRLIITWRRSGHTCVLSGAGVSVDQLARLAAWK